MSKTDNQRFFDYHYIKEIEEDDRGEVFADDIEDEVQKSFGYDKQSEKIPKRKRRY